MQKSQYMVNHLSDVLSYSLMHKFGGIYLDLDQIVLKPFPDVPNFIGAESDEFLGITSGLGGVFIKHLNYFQ